MLDQIRAMMRGELPPTPISTLIGFTLDDIDPAGRATVSFEAKACHANPMGTLHGGVLCDVADAAMGMALAATLAEGESMTTLELKINFLKPVWTGQLLVQGHVVKRGRTVALCECDVTDAGGSLCARASSTCMILAGTMARGR